jgi:hypothetical protein
MVFRKQGPSHRRDAGRYAVNPLGRRIARRLRGLAVIAAVGYQRQAGGVPVQDRIVPMGQACDFM